MAFKTADEEAIEANFIVDIQRIGKKLQKFLNNQLPRDESGFSFKENGQLGCMLEKKSNKPPFLAAKDTINIALAGHMGNKKITFEIVCVMSQVRRLDFRVPVSHREVYTKKEIERAEKSIMVKVLEALKKIS